MRSHPAALLRRATQTTLMLFGIAACEASKVTTPPAATQADAEARRWNFAHLSQEQRQVVLALRRGDPLSAGDENVVRIGARVSDKTVSLRSTDSSIVAPNFLICSSTPFPCMVVNLTVALTGPTAAVGGEAYMEFADNVPMAVESNGSLTREGHWAWDYVPFVLFSPGIDAVQMGDYWGATCHQNRYNRLVGTSRAGGKKVYLLPPVVVTWGPHIQAFDESCNPGEEGEVTEDLCGDEELRAPSRDGSPQQMRTLARAEANTMVPCSGPTGGGGGGILRCAEYIYEISFDGGLTWFQYGDSFSICEFVYELLRASGEGMNNAVSSVQLPESVSTTLKGVDRHTQISLASTSALRDGARAVLLRETNGAGITTILFDSTRSSANDLAAAMLVLEEFAGVRSRTLSAATHVRALVGDWRATRQARAEAGAELAPLMAKARNGQETELAGGLTGKFARVWVRVPKGTRTPRTDP